ncbi:MAG: hypothetical protein IKO07_07340 [Clostridia bacterium]|nr:hypothetical protein [Clostridia bacterium]
MANSTFTQKVMEILLSWMRLVTGWVWNFFQADMGGGFLNWFADNWVNIALTLIILGLVVDWLIWMIRWRPYWLWLRKRQIIYEEVDSSRGKREARPQPAEPVQPVRHMPRTKPESEYEDPFATNEIDPYAAATAKNVRSAARREDPYDWDAGADPYAAPQDAAAPYARPAASKQKAQSRRAVSGERPD